MKDYHCCATCKHFRVHKNSKGINYVCSRLGYETQSTYKFNCWDPKDHVKKLLIKDREENMRES